MKVPWRILIVVLVLALAFPVLVGVAWSDVSVDDRPNVILHVELYDLANDLGEQKDLSTAMPDKASQLRDKLRRWRGSVDAKMPPSQSEQDS